MVGSSTYSLSLADGSCWAFDGQDEVGAQAVAALAAAMRLPCQGLATLTLCAGGGQRIRVVGAPGQPGDMPPGELVCHLSSPGGDETLFVQLLDMIEALAAAVEAHRGGVLVHAALAAWTEAGRNVGVLLAASGGTGKTTASNRLPPPWRSLCDDTTLVVQAADGSYWAHPFPSLSRFLWGGPGGSWATCTAVPLGGICFLQRDPDQDRAERLGTGEAVAYLLTAVEQATAHRLRRAPIEQARATRQQRFAWLSGLANTVPAYRLHITLNGPFWEELARVLG